MTFPDLYLDSDYSDLPAHMVGEVVPTGGVVVLRFINCDQAAPWTLTRLGSGSTSPVTLLNAGNPVSLWVDSGDGQKVPLDPNQTYTYTLVTPAGAITLGPLQPSGFIEVAPDNLTIIMLRCLQSAFANLAVPTGWVRPEVIHAMPVRFAPKMPVVSFALETISDSFVPIGQNVEGYNNVSEPTIYDVAQRRYRVTVMTGSVDEREFYRDSIIGMFRSILGPLLARLGQNVTHNYHSASSQVAGEKAMPGYYFADIALQFSGMFSVGIAYPNPGTFTSIGSTLGETQYDP